MSTLRQHDLIQRLVIKYVDEFISVIFPLKKLKTKLSLFKVYASLSKLIIYLLLILSKTAPVRLVYFLMGQSQPSSVDFCSFETTLTKNCNCLQNDSNLDQRYRRWTCWPVRVTRFGQISPLWLVCWQFLFGSLLGTLMFDKQ